MTQPSDNSRNNVTAIAAATIGNTIEWYDILIYAYLAGTIAKLFFPNDDPTVSSILAFGAFGLSFVARPLGAIVLGRYADRKGRKPALVLVSGLMFLGTAIVVMTPTYETIGIAAPIILFAARLIQGFSAGGEFGSATAFLLERDPKRAGFISSWQFASQGLAMVLAALAGYLLSTTFSPQAIEEWAWRLPFAFGLLIGPIAVIIRRYVHEDEPVTATQNGLKLTAATDVLRTGAMGIGLVAAATVSVYLLIYMPTFAEAVLGLPAKNSFSSALVAGGTLILLTPVAGHCADRYGPLKVAACVLPLLVVSPPIIFFYLVSNPTILALATAQMLLAAVAAGYLGILPLLLARLFSEGVRATGFNIAYNLAVMIGGGFAPMVFTLLIASSIGAVGPGYYLSFAAMISLIAFVSFGIRLARSAR